VATTWSAGITAAACAEQRFFLLIEIFFLLKKEKLTGTRLTHPLFAKLAKDRRSLSNVKPFLDLTKAPSEERALQISSSRLRPLGKFRACCVP
jgi:hypothetical protein